MSYAVLISLAVCALSALLEGVFAGKNVKQYFAKLRFPSYSIPLRGWYVIGGLYYVVCFVVLYRILRHDGDITIRNVALALILVMMSVNALWNLIFFRIQSLFVSFVASIPYSMIAIALFICLIQFDRVAAWALVPYLLYLIYANLWGYGLWKLNGQVS